MEVQNISGLLHKDTFTIVVKTLSFDGIVGNIVFDMQEASEWILSRVIEQYGNSDFIIQAFIDNKEVTR